jgi:hypothetical protein
MSAGSRHSERPHETGDVAQLQRSPLLLSSIKLWGKFVPGFPA